MQKRLVRKLDLEMFLSQVKQHPSPKPSLEQYTISDDVAATMLYLAAYANDDIIGKTVLDLGCGTGKLALGAAFLDARQVVGVDIDKTAVTVAFENSVNMRLKERVQWLVADIDVVHGRFDTVLQNPPFGVQKEGADRKFLERALEIGRVVYSLHKRPFAEKSLVRKVKASSGKIMRASPSFFLKNFVERRGGKISEAYVMVMTIPHMFGFHTKKKHEFIVDLCVMESGSKGSGEISEM